MMLKVEVAVIGAGIVGSAIAAALVESGIQTALIDSGCAGAQGASRYSGGITRIYDPDPEIAALAASGLQAADLSPVGRAFSLSSRQTGVLYIGSGEDEPAMRAAASKYGGPAYPMRLLSAAETARASSFPKPAGDRPVMFEPHACIGNVRATTALLAHHVKTRGKLLENLTVMELMEDRHGTYIKTATGTIFASITVIACGAETPSLLPGLPLITKSIPLVRMVVSKQPYLPIIDTVADSYVVPLADTIVQIGSRVREAVAMPVDLEWKANDAVKVDALRRLSMITGQREQGAAFDVLPGYDAYTPDGRPIVGFVNARETQYAVAGLNGIGYKLAASIGLLAAKQIASCLRGSADTSHAMLKTFAPGRFRLRRDISPFEEAEAWRYHA
jgi:glycine/D-amino acid oxidase-like deaminating enzyme